MSVPISEVTPDLPCPSRTGGVAHYPRFCNGVLVTMPGAYSSRLRWEVVLLSLCGTAYLAPPVHDADTPSAVCSRCERARVEECGETVELAAMS